ncbi:mechanosensitive ion channel family protein [Oceanicella sp. SM1341]|uniref:mechanosensitive ion channel family protein n=1 Tax=Oceanicella sp. SM1341 TaxID=1548889 RepID=UPI000E4CFF4B|nr:DUF3772 domain-containing protein [Oceanicella sp. SM1341]
MIRHFLALLLLVAALGLPTAAQEPLSDTGKIIDRWETLADRAKTALENEESTTPSLERLRLDLVQQRAEAETLRDRAETALAPLRAQSEALGPPPGDGEEEAGEIVRRRAELDDAITAAEVPVKAASSVARQTEALIASIDEELHRRFTAELLSQHPLPLSPSSWGDALSETARGLVPPLSTGLDAMLATGAALWVSVGSGALGLMLLLGIRSRVMRWFERRLSPSFSRGQREHVWVGAGLTFAALLLPAAGATLLLYALDTSGLLAGIAPPLVRDLGGFAAIMVTAYWLSEALFGPDVPARQLLPMAERPGRKAARMTLLLGLVTGLDHIAIGGETSVNLSLATLTVLNVVLVVTGAVALYRLGRALIPDHQPDASPEPDEDDDDDEDDGRSREPLATLLAALVARGLRLVALIAPVLAVLGFFAASRFLFYPTVRTGALIGIVLVLVALVQDGVEAALTGTDGTRKEHSPLRLLPILAAVGLIVLCLPALALIWGARESELGEIWYLLNDGLSIGDARIRPMDFLICILVFAVGYFLTQLVQRVLSNAVLPQTRLDSGGQKAVVSMAGYVGLVIAAVAAIAAGGLDLSSLAIVAGALSVGVGFGLQNVVSNFVSGLILLLERPVKEGDWIRVGEWEGTVKRISVRATSVQTFDRAIVVVPNADLITTSVLNRTHSSTTGRLIIPVSVAYGTDTRRVARILGEIGDASLLLLRRPAPFVLFKGFGASALEFELRGYLRDVSTTLDATNELNHAIAERFRDEEIEIPFAQSDVTLRNAGEIAALLARGAAPGPGGESGSGSGGTDGGNLPAAGAPRGGEAPFSPPAGPDLPAGGAGDTNDGGDSR